jgi:hypothetical protein
MPETGIVLPTFDDNLWTWISALAPMMSFSRDNLESFRLARVPYATCAEKMNWTGVTANTDYLFAAVLSAWPYEDRRPSLILPVVRSVSSLLSTTLSTQLSHPHIVPT